MAAMELDVSSVSPLMNGDGESPRDNEIQKWRSDLLKAITKRSISDVQNLLDTPPCDLGDLINEPLLDKSKGESRKGANFGSECTRFSLPLVLAAVHGDVEIVNLLYDNGASLYIKDAAGDSVIHALVWMAAFKPDKERGLCVMLEEIMRLANTEENKKCLLMEEDRDGLRPIELASKLGTFLLILCIIETEGVYKSEVCSSPIARRVTYNIGEYEHLGPKGRTLLAPLNFLRQMPEDAIEKDGAMNVFKHPAMTKWIEWKLHRSYKMVAIAFLMWIATMVAITMLDEFGPGDTCPANSSVTVLGIPKTAKLAFFYADVVLELLHVCAVSFVLLRWYWYVAKSHPSGFNRLVRPRELRNGGVMLKGGTFYFIHGMRTLALFIYAVVTLAAPDSEWSSGVLGEVMLVNRIGIQIMLMLSLLYYVQLFPSIGYTVSGIARCVRVFSYFMVVFLIFVLAASEGVRSVARYYCIPELGYSADSLYSTVQILLSIIDLRELLSGQTQLPFPVIFIQVFIVAILAILLLNYLIALLSDVVAKVEDVKTTIYNMSRLSVAIDFMFFPNEMYNCLPNRLRWKQTPLLIEVEEYTV